MNKFEIPDPEDPTNIFTEKSQNEARFNKIRITIAVTAFISGIILNIIIINK